MLKQPFSLVTITSGGEQPSSPLWETGSASFFVTPQSLTSFDDDNGKDIDTDSDLEDLSFDEDNSYPSVATIKTTNKQLAADSSSSAASTAVCSTLDSISIYSSTPSTTSTACKYHVVGPPTPTPETPGVDETNAPEPAGTTGGVDAEVDEEVTGVNETDTTGVDVNPTLEAYVNKLEAHDAIREQTSANNDINRDDTSDDDDSDYEDSDKTPKAMTKAMIPHCQDCAEISPELQPPQGSQW
jgi:hypothetical protein